MRKLLSNLFSGIASKLLPGIFGLLKSIFGGIWKAFLTLWEKWDWGDRITAFLVVLVMVGGLVNLSLKNKNVSLKKEKEELTQELILQRTFVAELQTLVQGQTLSNRQLKQSLDSANTQGFSLAQDLDMWRGITAETQSMIKQLVHQRDSLKQSKIVYVDRCFNAFGKQVDCAKRNRSKR